MIKLRDAHSRTSPRVEAPGAVRLRLGVRFWAPLIGIALLALGLRLYGINFGLPQQYYWDEPTVVQRAMRFGNGNLNPDFFFYPTLYLYVTFVLAGVYFAGGLLSGAFTSVADFAAQFFIDPTGVYLVVRGFTALVGAGCVLLTYFVGQRFFDRRAGLFGALFLAVSVIHSTHSHLAITDVPQSLFILAAYLPLYAVWERGHWRDYALCGLLIGLGMATKYLAVFVVPALVAAHLLQARPAAHRWGTLRWWRERAFAPALWLGIGAAGAGYFIGSPFAVIDFAAFLRDYRTQAELSALGSGNSLVTFLTITLPGSLGWPLYLLSLCGIALLCLRRRAADLVFLVFPLIYFGFVARYPVGFPRYMVPLEPLLALTAGLAVQEGLTALGRRQRWALHPLTIAAVLCLLIAPPLLATWRWNMALAHEVDPRTHALTWLEADVPAGTVLAVQRLHGQTMFNVPLLSDRVMQDYERNIPQGGRFDVVRANVFAALQQRPLYREVPLDYDLAALQRAGVRYVFVSDQNWERVFEQPQLRDRAAAFKQQLEAEAVLIRRFAPEPGSWTDRTLALAAVYPFVPPIIEVYELR